jgi:hypothetical protein
MAPCICAVFRVGILLAGLSVVSSARAQAAEPPTLQFGGQAASTAATITGAQRWASRPFIGWAKTERTAGPAVQIDAGLQQAQRRERDLSLARARDALIARSHAADPPTQEARNALPLGPN